MKIAFMASDAIALNPIKFVCENHELLCVISNPDRPKGRGKKLSPNEVSQWALDNNIELMRPEGKPDDSIVARMRELGVELIIVMAYGCILKDNVLNYGKYPCLNLHASILPELRGASPIETAIAIGKTNTGVSLMAISPAMDEGDVADVCEVEIDCSDTSKTLREKISIASVEILKKNLPLLERGELKFYPQDSSKATYARKLSKQDMYLDFSHTAQTLCNRIRAFGAGIFVYENEVIKIFDVDVVCNNENFSEYGKILEASSNGLLIACSQGVLRAKSLQRPCCKVMNAKDFFAGFKMQSNFVIKSEKNKSLLK
ncbi:MAG: methionyl-tRNA formyltransferase [Opitutales bacterium]|nr:methionyl-tRNA formyltransferase [Opitutales bacterium]